MTVPEHLVSVIEDQTKQTIALDSPEIVDAAKHIAFYVAMIAAAIDDPLDNPEEQVALITYFETQMQEHLELYMDHVNEQL